MITDIDPEGDLAEHILTENCGEIVLHAGHSYTLEDFMAAVGVAEEDLPSVTDYGDLWILTVYGDGTVLLETSHYGD